MTPARLVLASSSPRRLELVERLGLAVEVLPPDVDETARPGEAPMDYVRRLASEKAIAAIDRYRLDADALVIAADTTVDLDGRILGKPADAAEAREMLRAMSSRTHRVHTGVGVAFGGRVAVDVATTLVTFTPVTAAAAEWYIGTGEPFDKAGGYGLQGAGGVFVASVKGSVSNVVGLPLTTVVALARSLGCELVG